MLLEVASYVATATLARRSGGREKDKQAVLSPLRIELRDQRLEPRPQVYRIGRCFDCPACARKEGQDESGRKLVVYTVHAHLYDSA